MIQFHLAEETIDREDIESLIEWLKTHPRLTQGELTVQFQEQWSRWLGREYSLFCNSGSSANLLMFSTLLLSGKLKNKKVIIPATGWSTSAAPAIQLGFEPILCESDPDTFGLNLEYLETLLKKHHPNTVLMVQALGVPHKMSEMRKLKERYGFFLLEDACAAIGSITEGKKIGTFGDMASFSFYFGHQISTIEGGMVSTDDKDFYDLLLMCRSHGWGKDLDAPAYKEYTERYRVDDFNQPFVFYLPGFNVRSTDLNAFIGLRQIAKLDEIAARRHANHLLYQKNLGGQFYIQRTGDPNARISSISFAVVAEGISQRQTIVKALLENGIETRIFSAANLGLHPFWYERYGKSHFPIADRIYEGGLFLPNHPFLRGEDIDCISEAVLGAICVRKS